MEFLKKLFQKEEQQTNLDPQPQGEPEQQENGEEVTSGTKIKVVAALLVVGFAAYVAYWIQEPVEIRTDLLGSGSSMETGAQSSTEMQAGVTQEVSISNFAFDPATLNVEKGTTVVWTNKDTVPHNIVGDNFSSSALNPGESFAYTFNTEGSFAYKCSFHPQMKGFVIVGTPSKDQVLSGFGAGSSLGLESEAAAAQNQPVSQEAVTSAAETPVMPQMETPPVQQPEQLFTSTAAAPAVPLEELHNAALQSLSSSLSNVGNVAASSSGESAQGSQALSAEQQAAAAAEAEAAMAAQKGKLASSGPEDVLYAGMFGLILFLNRKKLRKLHKSLQ